VNTATQGMAAAVPRVLRGTVMHRRLHPIGSEFSYDAFTLALPLSQLASLPSLGIAWNRRALVSFFDRDHGERNGSALEPWIRQLLAAESVCADGEIVLYALPRMLGYVFNPVSFWVCHDSDGNVRAVLCEVCNTFGEQHNYLLAHPDGRPLASGETLCTSKAFHVSPFNEVKGGYRFRFHFAPDRWLARIDYDDNEGRTLLETAISGTAVPLSRAAVRSLLWRYRWFTLGVILRIHWQALKLGIKRVPHVVKPPPPMQRTTR
jgi:uncharacterized protein